MQQAHMLSALHANLQIDNSDCTSSMSACSSLWTVGPLI